jgi:lipopolysaccharide/colanic/teichoic acid biosynthesis glycosyltransferase
VFNVLKGEMSFVGPRPERPEFVKELEKTIPYYRLRLSVKPGITGWAQIHYPYGASERDAREKLRYDLYYIKHFNSSLDIQILINTVAVVLWGRGAR